MQLDLLDIAIQKLQKGFLFFWMELVSGGKSEINGSIQINIILSSKRTEKNPLW